MVLLRHLVVQVEQHRVYTAEGIHTSAGLPAEIQGVHVESEDIETYHYTDCIIRDILREKKRLFPLPDHTVPINIDPNKLVSRFKV